MPTLDTLVSLNITLQTKFPTRAGFGTPLFACFHSVFPERQRLYTTLPGMIDDGFTVYDQAYKMAAAAKSQNPSIKQWRIGRRANAFTQAIRITPINTTVGYVYSYVVVSPDGTSTTVTYTVQASDTVADICTGLQTGFNAITDLTATDATTHIDLAADNAGEIFSFSTLPDPTIAVITDRTTDPGLAADLTAINGEESDWYALALDQRGSAEAAVAAAWMEANKRGVFAYADADSNFETNHGALKTAGYDRTFGLYAQVASHDYREISWLGRCLPEVAGSINWAFKTLAGISADPIKGSKEALITAQNGNTYSTVAGLNITWEGKMASGEWIDVIRGIDQVYARIQEAVIAVLKNNGKVPFTDRGVSLVTGAIQNVLNDNVSAPGRERVLAADPAPKVTAPKVADVSAADKAARTLPDIAFTGTLSGAINRVAISGTVSV